MSYEANPHASIQQAQMSPIPKVGVQKSDPLGMGSGVGSGRPGFGFGLPRLAPDLAF